MLGGIARTLQPTHASAMSTTTLTNARPHASRTPSMYKKPCRGGPEAANSVSLPLGWLVRRASTAKAKTIQLLTSFAVRMHSSAVADFYATKYLAKPQQWLASVLGPLIAGFKRVEEEQKQSEEQATVKATALRKMRTAIFAANRSVWISSCEACLLLETGGSAVLSHADVAVHGRKAIS